MATDPTETLAKSRDIEGLRKDPSHGGLGTNSYVRLLGLKARDTIQLLRMVEKGFDFRTFTRLMDNIGLTQEQLAHVVRISTRTLNRRKSEGRLDPVESDRLLRASRIFSEALQLFEGDAEAARAWLSGPVRALGGMSPLEACRTELGAHEVEHLIGRLEHGVFT